MKKCFNNIIKVSIIFLMISCLFGCSSSKIDENIEQSNNDNQETYVDDGNVDKEYEVVDENANDEVIDNIDDAVGELELNSQQLNSITMLNYLNAISAEIIKSEKNRLYLEEVYNSLYNNINPNAVDIKTEDHIGELLDLISNLKLDNKKLEQIQYIFDQRQAQVIHSAIPSPLSILNVIQADNPLKSLVAVAGLALNSIENYKTTTSQNELELLQSNWEIEASKIKNIDNFRTDAFKYLTQIVRDNDLPGEYTINSNSFDDFAEKKNDKKNHDRVIEALENNVETYKAYYDYWLVLADNYYNNGDYNKCLDAINEFEELDVHIFRKNIDLAKVLPGVICSVNEVLEGEELISAEKKYADLLYNNAPKEEWSLRYFAIQTYIDLFSKTNKKEYLENAYKWTKDVIDSLIDEQIKKNDEYLSDIETILLPEKNGKKVDEEAKEYNKYLKEKRKTELSPIYEPLLINCELLFSLAEELNVSDSEKNKLENILHNNSGKLFLADTVNQQFYFNSDNNIAYSVSFDKDEVKLFGNALCENASLYVKIDGKTYSDYIVKKVNRKGSNIDDFEITLESKLVSNVDFSQNKKVEVFVAPHEGLDDVLLATFSVSTNKVLFWTKYNFERIN